MLIRCEDLHRRTCFDMTDSAAAAGASMAHPSNQIERAGYCKVLNLSNCLIFILVFNQLDAQNLFYSKFYFTRIGGRLVHETATYRCDDTRGCVMQF